MFVPFAQNTSRQSFPEAAEFRAWRLRADINNFLRLVLLNFFFSVANCQYQKAPHTFATEPLTTTPVLQESFLKLALSLFIPKQPQNLKQDDDRTPLQHKVSSLLIERHFFGKFPRLRDDLSPWSGSGFGRSVPVAAVCGRL